AYLQEVNRHFDQSKLYPFLSDLVAHYNNLLDIKEKKEQAINSFPKELTRIDFENFKLHYENLISDDSCMEVIEEIIDYALPLFKNHLKQGAELYDFVEDKLSIFPVGVMPIRNDEGYLFIRKNMKKETRVYEYSVSFFENANEQYRSIRTQYVTSYSHALTNTYENIKVDLGRQLKKFANPATYAVEVSLEFPLNETILPVAKRALIREVSRNA